MADFHTTLFDTWQPGTTANAEATLFQTPRGGDSTHNERFTNARGAGQLPAEESFQVQKRGVMADEIVVEADHDTYLYGALMEIRLKDRVVFSAPVMALMQATGRSGPLVVASAGAVNFTGPLGDGFELNIPILIMGGTRFDVRMVQGAAFAAAVDFKVILEGVLGTPD